MFDAVLMSSQSLCPDVPSVDKPSTDIMARYNGNLIAKHADTAELIRTAQSIRYQVYCLERRFENAAEHADCLEKDAFDGLALHSLIFNRSTKSAIGTARLIPSHCTTNGLPIQRLLGENGLRAEDHFPLETVAEISRFSISSQLRRQSCSSTEARRQREMCTVLPCLGLLQDLLRRSIALNLTHWAAVMEPKLLRMLAAMGIYTTKVGPLVSYHGLRQPAYCRLTEMLERLRREQPHHWMIMTDAGTLVPAESGQRLVAPRAA